MFSYVQFGDFCNSFSDTYKDNFTYEGKRALFDYIEEYEESTGEQIELDTIGLCCEYSEHPDATEAANEYFDFEGMTYDENGDELETAEQVEEKALKYLEDHTQVIKMDNGGVIIQAF